jgi:hypothetical protein
MRRATPLTVAVVACLVAAAPAPAQRPIAPPDVVPHLEALQAIADRNGGNRSAGRPGEVETVEAIVQRLEAVGWRVGRQAVPFPYWEERTPPVVHDLVPGRDVLTVRMSGNGDVTARVRAVRGSGCRREHVRGFRRGDVALLRPGGCFFAVAARRLQRAGARAVLFSSPSGPTGLLPSTLVRPVVRIPVLTVTTQAGRRLAALRTPVRVKVDGFNERRTGTNVIAERPGTRPREVVMAGAHLDSVPEGPGINDNGSGIAALLAIAQRLNEVRLADTVRLGFWTAEEWGLFGSVRYIQRLPRRERRRIGVYLNADMVGSPNGAPQIYDAHASIERPLRRRLPGAGEIDIYGVSDHTPFIDARIPSGGVFTGSNERKTAAQARRFGGRAGAPRDPCYHRACDTVANVDPRMLALSANAIAGALVAYARR